MKTRLYTAILFIFSIFLIVLLFVIDSASTAENAGALSYFTINQDSGFYDTDLSIEVSVPHGIDVYYTTDCSVPVPGGQNTTLYTEPILLPCTDEIIVHTLKFYAHSDSPDRRGKTLFVSNMDSEDDTPDTTIYTFTYIIGSGVSSRFHTLVISISGEEDDLFGYENGILTGGKLRQEYLNENPDAEAPYFKAPANYNLKGFEAERPVTLQVFDRNGQQVLSQNCGIRVQGDYARENNQRSLQLFARHIYDIYGNFHADLFPELRTETSGTLLARSNRLLLKNSGQDFNHAFIRDTLVQSLANQYGYPFTSRDEPAAVFINGRYTGFYWLREPFNSGYLENLYGDFPGEFITLTLDEYAAEVEADEDPAKQEELMPYYEEFQDIYDTFKDAAFSDSTVFEEFSDLIDVENYLQYYAIEVYIGNKDWPYGNIKAYRYVSPDGIYEKDSVFDGRYRYLLYDTDYSFYLNDLYIGYAWDEDNIAHMSTNNHSPLWSNLMSRSDCRNLFVRNLCDLMNDVFSYDNIKKTLSELHEERSAELSYFLEHSDMPDASVTMDHVDSDIDIILEFAENRPEAMHGFIQSDFPVFYPYTVSVSLPQNAVFSLNSISNVENGFTGIYYAESGLDLKASPDMGHTFSHYIINGEIFEDPELSLTYEDLERLLQISPVKDEDSAGEMEQDLTDITDHYLNTLDIEIIITDAQDAVPVISRIHYQNPDEIVEFYNPCEHTLSLDGLYLSTESENLKSMELPAITLQSGERFLLYGRKNSSEEALSQHRLNFPLRKYETLYLSDHTGTILQQIDIPDIDHPENDYILDLYTGKFYEGNRGVR